MLTLSLKQGFDDVSGLKSDDDLANLHHDARWAPLVAKVEAARTAVDATSLPRLIELSAADQADRQGGIDWSKVKPRDDARRAEVQKLIDAHALKTARDYHRAAMVFQHGETIAEIEQAHRLALEAVKLNPRFAHARWLAATTEDRALMYAGKPQRWGTQFKRLGGPDGGFPNAPDARWVLWPADGTVSDAKREEWSVPALAEAQARADQMNEHKP